MGVGWGTALWLSEYTDDGYLVFYVYLWLVAADYRVLEMLWQAADRAARHRARGRQGYCFVYASWNEVTAVYCGASRLARPVAAADGDGDPQDGIERCSRCRQCRYAAAVALDAQGKLWSLEDGDFSAGGARPHIPANQPPGEHDQALHERKAFGGQVMG